MDNIREVADAARAINGIVAPSIMISACALIILALQGKYSNLIDRLRHLNDERRRVVQGAPATPQRMSNVVDQIEMILLRARLVRNSIVSLYTAIVLFVLSSIVIGARLTLPIGLPVGSSLVVFMIAMLLVLAGVVYALRDISIAYKVVQLEVRGVKELQTKQKSQKKAADGNT